MGWARRWLLRALLALPPFVIPLAIPFDAQAQIGASAAFESDYRVQGVSLSGERPVISLDLAYDHPSGAYAGVSALATQTFHDGVGFLAGVADIGYAGRIGPAASWDAGVTYATLETNTYVRRSRSYAEIYSGFTYEDLKAYVYYEPDYLGQGVDTVYLDLSASVRPAPRWRLFGHAGVLTPVAGGALRGERREGYDLRAGAALEIGRGELQLAWTDALPYAYYPYGEAQARQAVVVQVRYFF